MGFFEFATEALKKSEQQIKEKAVNKQRGILKNLSCPICKGTQFKRGYLSNSMYGFPTFEGKGLNAVLCCRYCGHMMMFANFTDYEDRDFSLDEAGEAYLA